MQTPSRREFLAAVSSGAAVALAGCGGAEGHFLVTDVRIIHQDGQREGTYPQDILVRVEMENDFPNAQETDLETTLSYIPDGADSPEEIWTDTWEDLTIPTGSTREVYVLFENAYEPGRDVSSEYEADAALADAEE